MHWTRRRFLVQSGRALGTAATLPALVPQLGRASPAGEQWGWAFDATGDGVIDAADRELVAAALERHRGSHVRVRDGWDPRADVLAEGHVTRAHLAAVESRLGRRLAPRPIVVCWHYGWYGRGRRRGEPTTMRYLGGSYSSRSSRSEEEFNRLKEEFGISADMLSWIDQESVLGAYEAGYLAARNRGRRLTGLLYEAPINLGGKGRLDFGPERPYASKLIRDFRRMGHWLRRAAGPDSSGLLRVDGRPAVYVFGSHTFGTTHRNLPHVGRALVQARDAFGEAFGTPPFLIGDESLFPADPEPGPDRLYRAAFFDAVSRYHHYDEAFVRRLGSGADVRLDGSYRRALADLERRTMAGYRRIRNRFTDAPVLVIPSAAAGFAKRHMPTLAASGEDYAALLRTMQSLTDEHIEAISRMSSGTAAPALVFVGSWNEEFEGHALMPAASNRALHRPEQSGFDWLYAIKSLYGWNHWGQR